MEKNLGCVRVLHGTLFRAAANVTAVVCDVEEQFVGSKIFAYDVCGRHSVSTPEAGQPMLTWLLSEGP